MSLFEDLQRVLDLNKDNKFEELAKAKKSLIKKISSINNPNCRIEYPHVLTMLKLFVEEYKSEYPNIGYLLEGFQIYLVKKERYGGEKTYYINMIIANELIKIEAKKINIEDHSGSTEYEMELIWKDNRVYLWSIEKDLSKWKVDEHITDFLIWANEDSQLTCALLDVDNYTVDEFDETIDFI